jgi:lysophospholipase L1-like esterase
MTIVCFGDSITFGVGAQRGRTYPELLAERLSREVINAGVPGETSAEGLERLDEILDYDPWLVIVELGGNDLLQQKPRKETEDALRAIVQELLEAGTVPVLVEIHGPFGGAMEEIFEDLAEEYRIPLVEDVLPKILKTPSLKADPIHPNSAGYELLAEAVEKKVRPLIRQREHP